MKKHIQVIVRNWDIKNTKSIREHEECKQFSIFSRIGDHLVTSSIPQILIVESSTRSNEVCQSRGSKENTEG